MADDDEEVAGSKADPYSVLANSLGGSEKSILQLMQQRQAGIGAQQQKLMDMMQQQEGPLSQTGMSDYQRAAMLFQAAGALAKPTRSGGLSGLMEGVGGAGEAVAGPLSKADEAQRARQQQLQQLQLARQKLAVEMSGNQGVSPSDMMKLVEMKRANEEETPTPSEFERVIGQLSPEERAKALRVKAGLEAAAEKPKLKEVSDKTLSDFAESGGTLADIDELSSRFKPEFAGKTLEVGADIQNLAGRKGFIPGYKEQAEWWSDYAERRNVARNALFGSAVTTGEKKEFEKADISPGMAPDVIKTKLARQREIARAAAYKLAKAKELQGADIAPIEAALGYKLTDLAKSAKSGESGQRALTLEEIDAELAKRNK
jgi:hypothetical protein